MTVEATVGRRGGTWPKGVCRRCDAEVQVYLLHPIVFTHRGKDGAICPGSGMYCKEPASLRHQ